MGKPGTINYTLAAAFIASGLTLAETAPKVGAKSAESLRSGLKRLKLTARGIGALQPRDPGHSRGALTRQSDALKATFAGILANHSGALANVPAKSNLKHLRAVGEALEPLARTAKIVHGWDSSEKAGLLLEMCDSGAVIDLEPAAALPADCALEATTGSVPPAGQIADVPQDAQADVVQDNAS